MTLNALEFLRRFLLPVLPQHRYGRRTTFKSLPAGTAARFNKLYRKRPRFSLISLLARSPARRALPIQPSALPTAIPRRTPSRRCGRPNHLALPHHRKSGIAINRDGAIYCSDFNNHRVRKFTPGGIIATVAGNGEPGFGGDGGLATDARLNAPTGLAFDNAGNLFIGDNRNNRIRRVPIRLPCCLPCVLVSVTARIG